MILGLERAGDHPDHGRHHHRLRALRRQPLRDLDRRRADAASSGSGIFVCVGVAIVQPPRGAWACATRWPWPSSTGGCASWTRRPASPRPTRSGAALIGGLFLMLVVLRVRPEPGAALPLGAQPHGEPALPALQRLPQGADAVPDPAHGRARVRLLPLRPAAPAVEPRGAEAGWPRPRVPPSSRTCSERFASAHADRKEAALRWLRDAERPTTSGPTERSAIAWRSARQEAVATSREGDGPGRYNDTNYIFPHYIVTQLPRGLCGLIIAVIFAAAMSTLSGELNSLATATMVDFYKRFWNTGGSDGPRPPDVPRVHRALGRLRGRRGPARRPARLGHRGGEPLRLVLLRLDPGRLPARGPGPAGPGWAATSAACSWAWPRWSRWRCSPSVHFLWYNVVGAVTVFLMGTLLTAFFRKGAAERTADQV